jgi:hypothetical protein
MPVGLSGSTMNSRALLLKPAVHSNAESTLSPVTMQPEAADVSDRWMLLNGPFTTTAPN